MPNDPPTQVSPIRQPFVRPYMVTAGRTVGADGNIAIETMVIARGSSDGLSPDHAAVTSLCASPLSVAEIAVQLGQPIGVARVLVADLTASNHVEQFDTVAAEGAAIVKRLIDGIRAL